MATVPSKLLFLQNAFHFIFLIFTQLGKSFNTDMDSIKKKVLLQSVLYFLFDKVPRIDQTIIKGPMPWIISQK